MRKSAEAGPRCQNPFAEELGITRNRLQGLKLLFVGNANEPPAQFLSDQLAQQASTWTLRITSMLDHALECISARAYDMALLDGSSKGLPTAVEFCRRVRGAGLKTPLVLLSKSGTLSSRLTALEAGADEFLVCDHLSGSEFLDRIRIAFLRSRPEPASTPQQRIIEDGGLSVDPSTEIVLLDGKILELTRQQRRLLLGLAARLGSFVRASELGACAGVQCDPEYRNLRNQIWRLRKKLGTAGRLLEGAPGSGYRLMSTRLSK